MRGFIAAWRLRRLERRTARAIAQSKEALVRLDTVMKASGMSRAARRQIKREVVSTLGEADNG